MSFVTGLLDDSSGYWFYWPMLGTGLGVIVAGVLLGGIAGLFGTDWGDDRSTDTSGSPTTLTPGPAPYCRR